MLPASFPKMTAKEFVENFKLEKDSFLKEFTNIKSQTEVQNLIQSMKLNEDQSGFLNPMPNLANPYGDFLRGQGMFFNHFSKFGFRTINYKP